LKECDDTDSHDNKTSWEPLQAVWKHKVSSNSSQLSSPQQALNVKIPSGQNLEKSFSLTQHTPINSPAGDEAPNEGNTRADSDEMLTSPPSPSCGKLDVSNLPANHSYNNENNKLSSVHTSSTPQTSMNDALSTSSADGTLAIVTEKNDNKDDHVEVSAAVVGPSSNQQENNHKESSSPTTPRATDDTAMEVTSRPDVTLPVWTGNDNNMSQEDIASKLEPNQEQQMSEDDVGTTVKEVSTSKRIGVDASRNDNRDVGEASSLPSSSLESSEVLTPTRDKRSPIEEELATSTGKNSVETISSPSLKVFLDNKSDDSIHASAIPKECGETDRSAALESFNFPAESDVSELNKANDESENSFPIPQRPPEENAVSPRLSPESVAKKSSSKDASLSSEWHPITQNDVTMVGLQYTSPSQLQEYSSYSVDSPYCSQSQSDQLTNSTPVILAPACPDHREVSGNRTVDLTETSAAAGIDSPAADILSYTHEKFPNDRQGGIDIETKDPPPTDEKLSEEEKSVQAAEVPFPSGVTPTHISTPQFSTAGMSKTIFVTDQALSNARNLLSESRTKVLPHSAQNSGGAACSSRSSFSSMAMASFQTAGKGETLKVTCTDLDQIKDIFADVGGDASNGMNRKRTMGAKVGSLSDAKKCRIVSNAAASIPVNQRTPLALSTTFSFQTAGSCKSIQVSKDDLDRARSLLSNESRGSTNRTPLGIYSARRQATHGHPAPTQNLANQHRSIDAPSQRVSLPGHQGNNTTHKAGDVAESFLNSESIQDTRYSQMSFATAGNGNVIQIQAGSLERAKAILMDTPYNPRGRMKKESPPGSSRSVPFSPPKPRVSFQTAGSSFVINTSDEAIGRARKLLSANPQDHHTKTPSTTESEFQTPSLPSRKLQPVPVSFHTAGRGDTLKVNKEDLNRAWQLLSSCDSSTAKKMPFPDSSSGMSISAATRNSNSFTDLFRTAGKGQSIQASESSLERARGLLSDAVDHSQPRCLPPYSVQPQSSRTVSKLPLVSCAKSFSGATSMGGSGVLHSNSVPKPIAAGGGGEFETPAIQSRLTRAARVSFSNASTNVPHTSNTRYHLGSLSIRTDQRSSLSNQSAWKSARLAPSGSVLELDPHRPTRLSFGGSVLGWANRKAILADPGKSVADSATASNTDGLQLHTRNAPRSGQMYLHETNNRKKDIAADWGTVVTVGPSEPHQTHATTLRMVTSVENCLEMGVNQTILAVNGDNGAEIIFDSTGRPLAFQSEDDETEQKLRHCLFDRGCDCTKISTKWIQNHCRWVCWKLASLERRFPHLIGTRYFTLQSLVDQLSHRFRKEVIEGTRSPLRKILNRDVAPSTMIILCVAKIDVTKASSACESVTTATDPCVYLELTDGWYSIYARPDLFLCRMIQEGKIFTGMKLMISNASLHGSEGGVDPLDEDYQSGPETHLRIFANSTRIARWDAKLGFLKMSRRLIDTHGLLHIDRLKDIVDGGGRVPSIDFEIISRHPMLFLQKSADHSSMVLTEAQEEARIHQLEETKSKVAEDVTTGLLEECSKVCLASC
jgi:breast cancer 2 susceptibility protein